MTLSIEHTLLVLGILLLASVFASKTSMRVGVPTLVFFLGIGMLAGSEGIGWIAFDNANVAQTIGIVALNFILFYGGFDTNWKEVRPVLWRGISLSTFGVLFTALSLGLFAHWLIPGFSLMEGLLLGAIVSSTDAAAVFTVLRSKKLGLRGGLKPMLEFESGSNDPMAYLLTLTFLHLAQNPHVSWGQQALFFVLQAVLGLIMGRAMGALGKQLINRIRIEFDVLYAVLVIALIFLTYSLTSLMQGSGFLAVYVFALYLGNEKLMHKKTIAKMFDGFAWIMQIVIFVSLGLLVYPSHILPVVGTGILVGAFLIFVARPFGVLLSLLPFKMPMRKKLFVSWVGLKGAAPIVLATFPLVVDMEEADMIFNIVFFVSATSVLLQGTTLSVVAKWLRVTQPFHNKKSISIDIDVSETEDIKSKFAKVILPSTSSAIGVPLVELGLPPKTTISLIIRGDKYITPYGATELEANDKLLIVSEDAISLTHALERLEAENNDADWGDM